MTVLRWVVLALALFQGLWLTFDGARALLVGDYLTPSAGQHAGQLGPWSSIVRAIGFEPRSTFIKCLHVFLGIAWLVSSILFQLQPTPGRWALLACAVTSLWYLPVGTVISIAVIILLLSASPQVP